MRRDQVHRAVVIPPRCPLCGERLLGIAQVIPGGMACCVGHPWCDDCATVHVDPACPEAGERILGVAAAAGASRRVRDDLAAAGIGLPDVPVELVDNLSPNLGEALKLTAGTRRWVSLVRVRSGLGPTRFGRVMAHELTHALIHMKSQVAIPPDLEEGLCELVSVVWLCLRAGPDVERHLHCLWANPDPVYGERMRSVVLAARRHSVPTVIGTVLRQGCLPSTRAAWCHAPRVPSR